MFAISLTAAEGDASLRRRLREASSIDVYRNGDAGFEDVQRQLAWQDICSGLSEDYVEEALDNADVIVAGSASCFSEGRVRCAGRLFSFAALARRADSLYVSVICADQGAAWGDERKCLGPAGRQILERVKELALDEGLAFVELDAVDTERATRSYHAAGFRFTGDCSMAENPETTERVRRYDGAWLGRYNDKDGLRSMRWCNPARTPEGRGVSPVPSTAEELAARAGRPSQEAVVAIERMSEEERAAFEAMGVGERGRELDRLREESLKASAARARSETFEDFFRLMRNPTEQMREDVELLRAMSPAEREALAELEPQAQGEKLDEKKPPPINIMEDFV